jgi:hypothetical protein
MIDNRAQRSNARRSREGPVQKLGAPGAQVSYQKLIRMAGLHQWRTRKQIPYGDILLTNLTDTCRNLPQASRPRERCRAVEL